MGLMHEGAKPARTDEKFGLSIAMSQALYVGRSTGEFFWEDVLQYHLKLPCFFKEIYPQTWGWICLFA